MSTSKAQEEDMMELMSGSIEGGKRGMKRGAHDVESNIEAGRKRAKGSGSNVVPITDYFRPYFSDSSRAEFT